MKDEHWAAINELRNEGYSVCVFTPEELRTSPPEKVENAMCEAGWDCISYWLGE